MSTNNVFSEVYKSLNLKILKHPSISSQFRKLLFQALIKEQENIKIISGLFKLDIKFIKVFIDLVNIKLNPKTDAENTKYDKMLYREFKRLKKFELIHKRSVSYLPRNLVLVSINPNHNSLLTQSYSKLDKVNKAITAYKDYCNSSDINAKTLVQIYSYLRLFHIIPFSKSILEKICWNDLVFTPVGMIALITYEDSFFTSNIETTSPRPYKIILLDKFVSGLLKKVFSFIDNSNEVIFNNISSYENAMNTIRSKSSIHDIKIYELRHLVRIQYMYLSAPLNLTFSTGIVVPVQLTLADIEAIFPGIVPQKLKEEEDKRIQLAFKRPSDLNDLEDEINWDIITFDIYELDELIVLLRYKDNMPTKEILKNALYELWQALKHNSSQHLEMIYKYLIYLINLVEQKRIRLSTAKNYIWLLNKHLFRMIEDFFDIKEHEVLRISNRLDQREYKDTSIERIKTQINRFFKYFSKKGIVIDIAGAFYPKSLVLKNEIESILNNIEVNYKQWKNIQKVGKHHKLYLMQLKVIVLLGFYCGLRLREVSSLLLDHIYVYENELHVDVDSKGIKKIGFKLKTTSSKRRIDVLVENQQHIKIIIEFLEIRSKLNKASKFLFLELSKYNGFLNKPINIEGFNYINKIIKFTTKRYCSYHSLRHSFATYQCQKSFLNGSSYPYEFLELSNKMGHRTPDTTIQSYIHAGVLFLTTD